MGNSRITDKYIATLAAGYGGRWTPHDLRDVTLSVRDRFFRPEPEVARIGVHGPYNKKWLRLLQHRFAELDGLDYAKAAGVSMARLVPNGQDNLRDWAFFAELHTAKYGSLIEEHVQLGFVQDLLPDMRLRFEECVRVGLVRSGCAYGYKYRQWMRLRPGLYSAGLIERVDNDPRHDISVSNASWWGRKTQHPFTPQTSGLLRDIHPESYLSQAYLDARLSRSTTTLKEWIQADPANRGTLEPFTDSLTKWTPPIDRIPQIREELFRAGRVYYWAFFLPQHFDLPAIPNPHVYYRPDLSAPWEAPDPIPEIYCADYWKDKDPSLTY